MKAATRSEHGPNPLNIGTIFQTPRGPNLEYWAMVISRKNRGKPINKSNIAKAITKAPFKKKTYFSLVLKYLKLNSQTYFHRS